MWFFHQEVAAHPASSLYAGPVCSYRSHYSGIQIRQSAGSVRAIRPERGMIAAEPFRMTRRSPFAYFDTIPEITWLIVKIYVRRLHHCVWLRG